MRLVEAFEVELWRFTRHRKARRHRRAPRQHPGKIRPGPDRRKVDSAIVKAIGIHQSRDQAKRQVVAITGWVANNDQPGSSSMVQKLLNLIAAPSLAKGASGN